MSESSANGHQPEHDAEHPNAQRAFATLGEFLTQDNWHPQPVKDKMAYRSYYYGKHGEMRCYAQIRPELEIFIFYAVATIKVAEERRVAAAEYLTRANYGLRLGNFELDFSDGEVRYKSSIDFEHETLTPNLIKHVIYPAVETMDDYLPGLMKVVFGGIAPEEAIREIEG